MSTQNKILFTSDFQRNIRLQITTPRGYRFQRVYSDYKKAVLDALKAEQGADVQSWGSNEVLLHVWINPSPEEIEEGIYNVGRYYYLLFTLDSLRAMPYQDGEGIYFGMAKFAQAMQAMAN